MEPASTLIETIIARIKLAEGLRFDNDVATLLKTKSTSLNGWKARGTIPIEKLIEYSREKNISLDWLINGRGIMNAAGGVMDEQGLYNVQTNQDIVYKLTALIHRGLQETGHVLSDEKIEQVVKILHRDQLASGEDEISYNKVLEVIRLAAPLEKTT